MTLGNDSQGDSFSAKFDGWRDGLQAQRDCACTTEEVQHRTRGEEGGPKKVLLGDGLG